MVQEVIVVPKEELEEGIAPASSTSNGSEASAVVIGFEYMTPGNFGVLCTCGCQQLQLLCTSNDLTRPDMYTPLSAQRDCWSPDTCGCSWRSM
jgi:hypothetical protein